MKMILEGYHINMVSTTADGASVNTSIYYEVLTQLSQIRNWLLKIHCPNHPVELAFKSAFKDSNFNKYDKHYKVIYSLLKNSGKLNNNVHAARKALGIEAHNFFFFNSWNQVHKPST